MGENSSEMNPGAPEWRPNVAAQEWRPSWLPAETQAAAAPAAAQQTAAAVAAPANEGEEAATTLDELAASIGAVRVSIGGDAPAASADAEQAGNDEDDGEGEAEEPALPKSEGAGIDQSGAAASAPAPAAPKPKVDPSGFEKERIKQLQAIENADPREHLNVVFIGHVDAGKSTLSGSILYEMGTVDKRTIEKFEQEAKERNRESWFLAYIMDTNEEERAKGKTSEVGMAQIDLEDRRITILDAPGHKNYVPAMISGASQADVGVLVISARKGEFESGFDGLGQTREHAMLAKTLGIQKLIVVINKMDEKTVQWSQDRYEHCVKKLRPFLKGCGFKVKKDVTFLPISAITGLGVKRRITADVCPWAPEINDGRSLLETLNQTSVAGRDENKPLRMTVIGRYNDRGVVLMGKVESGVVYAGQTICVCPNMQEVKVDTVLISEVEVTGAKPGENVLVRLGGITENEVSKGHVVSSRFFPVAGSTEVIAQLFIVGLLKHRPIMSAGYNAVFHAHTAEEECSVYELAAVLDKTGKIATKNPSHAKQGQTIICKIRLERSIVLEPFEKTMQLGRFTLRDEGTTIAIGIVKRCR